MPRPTSARVHALEVALAKAEARAEIAERLLDHLVARLAPTLAPAAARPSVVAPLADAAPTPVDPTGLTPQIRAACRKFDQGSDRQRGVNLQKAQELAAEGKTEAEIVRHLYRGEVPA